MHRNFEGALKSPFFYIAISGFIALKYMIKYINKYRLTCIYGQREQMKED